MKKIISSRIVRLICAPSLNRRMNCADSQNLRNEPVTPYGICQMNLCAFAEEAVDIVLVYLHGFLLCVFTEDAK